MSTKRVLVFAGCALAAIAIFLAAIVVGLRTTRGRYVLIGMVSRLSGYDVRAAAIDLGPRLVLHASELSVAVAGGPEFFHARDAAADFSPGSLLRARAERIEASAFTLDWNKLPTGGGAGGGARFAELRLVDGVIRGLTSREIAVPEMIFAREAPGGEFEVRGAVGIPAGDATISWSGRADASGKHLAVRGTGRLGDVDALLDDFGVKPGAERYFGPLDLRARARGEIGGAIRTRITAHARSPRLRDGARLRAAVTLDPDWHSVQGKLSARTPPLAPLRARVTLERGETQRLTVDATWRGVVLADLKQSLADTPTWLPQRGTMSIATTVRGSIAAPTIEARVDASDVAVADVTVGTAAAALRYENGALLSAAPGITLEKLAVHFGANTVTADRATFGATVRRQSDRTDVDLTDVALSGAGARSDDGVLQAAGLELGGKIAARLADDGTANVDVKLDAPSGEALYGRVYLDLAGFPASLVASVERRAETTRVENFSLGVTNVGRIEGRASFDVALRARELKVTATIPALAVPFERLVRESFKDAWPFLAETAAAGALTADVEYGSDEPARWRAAGRIKLRDGALTVKDPQVRLERYDLDVPFSLDTRAALTTPQRGSVHSGDIELGGLRIAPVELPLVAETNAIAVAQPITVPFAGGSVRIEGLRAYGLASDSPAMDARVTVEAMQLPEIARAAGWPRIEGTAGGDLGAVTLTSENVRTAGSLAIDMFGGHVELTSLGVDDLFSPVPALRLDAEAKRIDLRQATEMLGVGYISGIARAKIRGLEIAAGQPVRFDAELETVPTRGVSQRVSVAAIEQLTILGGADAGALTSSVLQLFDEYRYAKLGFRCSLQNDRFILHGIEEHDGKDFLVVGTLLPPTVNVISHNEVIAFKEMVQRLSRISSAAEGKARVQ